MESYSVQPCVSDFFHWYNAFKNFYVVTHSSSLIFTDEWYSIVWLSLIFFFFKFSQVLFQVWGTYE